MRPFTEIRELRDYTSETQQLANPHEPLSYSLLQPIYFFIEKTIL